MSDINLHDFCAVERGRFDLAKPFEQGGYLYATDGRTVARVAMASAPACAELSEAAPPDAHALVQRHMDTATTWSRDQIPELSTEKCGVCGGSGKLVKCGYCDGEGEFLGADDYYHECKRCGGDGYLTAGEQNRGEHPAAPCFACGGSGFGSTPVEFAGQTYNPRFLRRIRVYPGLEWSIGTDGALLWRCAGGFEGLVLPIINRFGAAK